MSIGDKVEYTEKGYTYQGHVIAIKEDGSTVLVSIEPLGKVIEIDNE